MLRSIALLPVFFASVHLLAQTGTFRPVPKWHTGDKRQVDVQVDTKIQIDTLTMNSHVASTYYMEVKHARKDGYELSLRSGTLTMPSMDMGQGSGLSSGMVDSVNEKVGAFINAIYEPISKLEFRYLIDRSGKVQGPIVEKEDEDKLTQAFQQAMQNIKTVFSKPDGETPIDIPEAVVAHLVDSLYSAMLQTEVNQMNYILKVYSTDFPLTGSTQQDVMVQDVEAPLHATIPELPGVLVTSLDRNDNVELIGRTLITYDPDAAYAAMKDSTGVLNREGLLLDEESVDHFDKRTGWLTQTTTAYRFNSGKVKLLITATSQLTPIS